MIIFLKKIFLELSVSFYVYVYLACIFVCALYVFLVCLRPEEGIRILGTGVTGCGELPCGYWEENLHALREHPVLLIE